MVSSFRSPGVYVQEVPSAIRPIAGVGTSTAGFIGVCPDSVEVPLAHITGEFVGSGDAEATSFVLRQYPVLTANGTYQVRVAGTTTQATLSNDDTARQSRLAFTTAPAGGAAIMVDYTVGRSQQIAPAGEPRLCTNFSEFSQAFGGFSSDAGQRNLAHAVYGFFNNGGTRCYVLRETAIGQIATSALPRLEGIDEIAIVAAPGIVDGDVRQAIVIHCSVRTQDRFAIFDSPAEVGSGGLPALDQFDPAATNSIMPAFSDYAALYFPWIEVADPASRVLNPTGSGRIFVPPSGHIAGIYARVDTNRGVHKAPANEPVLGALGLRYSLSRAQQDGLNPQGVNCIRDLNGTIRVWGARTIGGDANGEWKYLSVRRLFLFLRESIDEGLQWAVFEPNDANLWARISRNVSAFLTSVWRAGALFGTTPQEAFYVKCDAETNPPEIREAGQVVTEVGVAVVRPAEFVVFRISQWAGPEE
jgi:uncharacterized protein